MLLHTIFGALAGLSIGGFMGFPIVLLLLDNSHKQKAEPILNAEPVVSVFPTPESTSN
jgi:ABC-type phosphate/phosphonate transport system permease subunit